MAQEAVELHVAGMIEDGEALPVPSSLEAIMADPENADAVAFLVTVPEAVDRTMRVNITLPERLLRRIDERVKNRSAFLAGAAEKALAESWGRLRGSDPVQPKRIPVAGLGPAIHVFGADIMAGSRRGCPGRARARGFSNQDSRQNARTNCLSIFPGQSCRSRGRRGGGSASSA
jgi:hypothetical protein